MVVSAVSLCGFPFDSIFFSWSSSAWSLTDVFLDIFPLFSKFSNLGLHRIQLFIKKNWMKLQKRDGWTSKHFEWLIQMDPDYIQKNIYIKRLSVPSATQLVWKRTRNFNIFLGFRLILWNKMKRLKIVPKCGRDRVFCCFRSLEWGWKKVFSANR